MIFICVLGMAWDGPLSSSVETWGRFRGGSSDICAAARDASSILRVACSMALDAASMAMASRSVKCSVILRGWVGVGGKLSSSVGTLPPVTTKRRKPYRYQSTRM